jgi:hypothetical protein
MARRPYRAQAGHQQPRIPVLRVHLVPNEGLPLPTDVMRNTQRFARACTSRDPNDGRGGKLDGPLQRRPRDSALDRRRAKPARQGDGVSFWLQSRLRLETTQRSPSPRRASRPGHRLTTKFCGAPWGQRFHDGRHPRLVFDPRYGSSRHSRWRHPFATSATASLARVGVNC